MKTSYILSENNAIVDIFYNGILHVSFKEGGVLSTQLMREINILSKLKSGSCPKGIILSVHDGINLEESFRTICRKAERFAPGTPVSVVCHSLGSLLVARNYQYVQKPLRPYSVFDSFNESLAWTIETILKLKEPPKNINYNNELILSA